MKDLTKGNPLKLMIQFAVPLLIGSIFQLFYNLVDTRIVGEILGEQALAAVGATNSVSALIVGLLFGITNGFALKVARSYGAQDEEQLRNTAAMSLTLGTIITILLTVISVTYIKPLLQLLNTPPVIMNQSLHYIRIIFFGMFVTFGYNVLASILRAVGDTITPLIFLVISTVLNVILDYLFIKGFGMGVEGAAVATIVAQLFSVILCMVYLWRRYPILHLHKRDFVFQRKGIEEMLEAGFSMGVMGCLVSIGSVALQGSINSLGVNIIVSHTAARKITELYMMVFTVCGSTMATYCSQNIGAGKIDRVRKGLRWAITITFGWTLLVILSSYTIAPTLVKMVTGVKTDEIINTASLYLRIDTCFYFVTALIIVIRNAMQGIGDHITPIISSFIELVGKVLIARFLVPQLGYMGVIMAEPIVWILMVIPLLIMIKKNRVLRKEREIER